MSQSRVSQRCEFRMISYLGHTESLFENTHKQLTSHVLIHSEVIQIQKITHVYTTTKL